MRERGGCSRVCPFCVADPSNHKREVCSITGEILPFAELKIDEDCPLRDAGEERD